MKCQLFIFCGELRTLSKVRNAGQREEWETDQRLAWSGKGQHRGLLKRGSGAQDPRQSTKKRKGDGGREGRKRKEEGKREKDKDERRGGEEGTRLPGAGLGSCDASADHQLSRNSFLPLLGLSFITCGQGDARRSSTSGPK